MTLDRESIEIALFLQEYRQLHRYINGVDIEEDVFRSRYIAAGLERIFACSSGSESGIALFLLFLGALDYSELSQATGRRGPRKDKVCIHRIRGLSVSL